VIAALENAVKELSAEVEGLKKQMAEMTRS
jgi:regulator of replication initiation timing